jgi:hypothetical protein
LQSNYTSATRKNANEMTGVLLAILIVFTSKEGEDNLDKQMEEIRTANFIHLLEIMLLLENFCLSEEHKISDVKNFKKFTPYVLNTFKDTINRKKGCEMKLIKFHLPNHFGDDILRFGSMQNFDTGIGESHHKTEAKKPANHTQRRRGNFEMQVATRQVENIAINMAHSVYFPKQEDSCNEDIAKWYRYIYIKNKGLCIQQSKKGDNPIQCSWKDIIFQQQLHILCDEISDGGSVTAPFKFFSQFNKDNNIFRADPNYKVNEPWYDWVLVSWGQEIIPAKLLLFWDISEKDFNSSFEVGTTTIKKWGKYALAYSLPSQKNIIPAHGASKLVEWGAIENCTKKNIPKLLAFPVECIGSPVSAVPYDITQNIIDAQEWIFLKAKNTWYKVFI